MSARTQPVNERAVQVWSGQFREHFAAWLSTGRTRDNLLQSAADDLRTWLERSPPYAAAIQAIALGAAFNARRAASPAIVAELARVGREADLLITEVDQRRSARRVLLNLFIAE